MKILVRIEAPHFVAGCIAIPLLSMPENLLYKIERAAPIVSWMNGKFLNEVRGWCAKKGYKIETYEVGE